MAENSKIEWCDNTFNPWEGCTNVSPACDNCYAERRANHYKSVEWGHGQPRRRTSEANWRKPIRWNRRCQEADTRERVFCASLADVFDTEAPHAWRADLFRLIDDTPFLDWLLLTKRPQIGAQWLRSWCPRNVWFGATVENQQMAQARIPYLMASPRPAVRFLSMEPLLEQVDLGPWLFKSQIGWVIVGGETGPGAREMNPDWARSIRDQCDSYGVPFFMKQMTRKEPIPDDLMVRDYPTRTSPYFEAAT